MEQLLDKLKDLLTRQTAAYAELHNLCGQEKEAIIKNAVPEVEKIVLKEQVVLKTVKKLESERGELFSHFSEKCGLEKPMLKDIIALAKPDISGELETLAEKLEDIIRELRQLNTLNKKLIETQLSYTSFCINLMSAQSDSMGTYSGSGRLKEKNASRPMLDQSV